MQHSAPAQAIDAPPLSAKQQYEMLSARLLSLHVQIGQPKASYRSSSISFLFGSAAIWDSAMKVVERAANLQKLDDLCNETKELMYTMQSDDEFSSEASSCHLISTSLVSEHALAQNPSKRCSKKSERYSPIKERNTIQQDFR